MKPIREILASPEAKRAIEGVAPTQHVDRASKGTDEKTTIVSTEVVENQNITGYVEQTKERALDRGLDWLVRASGSEPVFLFIVAGLLAWAFLGIHYGDTTDWAVLISDIQAIVSYIFDSFLMRHQLNAYETALRVSAILRSRNISNQRMLRQVLGSGQYQRASSADVEVLGHAQFAAGLPTENWVGRLTNFASYIMGHIVTVGLYWVCIFVWIGFGHYCDWSDTWQLYINSATSALMVLIFAFLANVRERHNLYIKRCLQCLFEVDSAIELKLRTMTGDDMPNETVVIPAPKMNRVQRAIFYYADLVGTLTGIAILIIVMVVWVVIGPAMQFNSNWWLLIGTYAGLVGLNDGFVLRNVQSKFNDYEDEAFEETNLSDKAIFEDISIPDPAEEYVQHKTLSYRLSMAMGVICAHEITVILGVVLIIGLLVGASAMKWTTAGQLLCNIPPSIIESFFMMILITGHNLAESRKRVDLHNMYLRRLKVHAYVNGLEPSATAQSYGQQNEKAL
ncbi:Low-affinity iron/zinc ion transport protein fet4 [Tolypocladium ophioglossoides CBS 100239]|uniref:Low-affinity iron/zinc ion transport protein fet4 n=1 Tax=Tolypocladium ophioglossoides (strain CBS 100239) TaxID=1163406 RepID=A0A0L0NIR9_TOLOC|nr:Low-affinity iron/zinc ion transport protein fet4 [Tolypocladium ophioglossoides CBS 100239]